MSVYEEAFDVPLLSAPWHALPSSPSDPSRLILKYAPHPSRPGYIVLLTDLAAVYCEVLTGPGVPSRTTEVDRAFHANSAKGSKGKGRRAGMDEEDVIGRSEAALKDVGEMWDRLEGAKVEMKEHDYHDAVLSVQTDDFSWLFYLTELKGRQPLAILAQQLIAPLAGILLETNHIQTEGKPGPMELVYTLFHQSPTITQHMAAHHASSSKPKGATSKAKSSTTKAPASPVNIKTKAKPATPIARQADAEDAEEEEKEEYVSEEEQPHTRSRDTPKRSSTKPPISRSTDRSSSPERMVVDQDQGPRRGSPSRSTTPTRAPPPSAPRSVKATPTKSKARHIIESDDEAEAEAEGEESADMTSEAGSAAPEKSATPPPPAASASSQTSKKERERAEEEEMRARAEAMKRKMEGGGAGGGNLGRRRLRR
ncbi:uncharacterized protein MKK02DRAFT_44367 [Dioszegia hungarica]|uniref:Uncharacterized protein n=1 Tax=Dioszegia hungarica TaxID=4972 RepID=A0AA38LVF3_9TREE|nr:uncharacterized protein MKK02DRAFT_44367 [Dioszegia hungarica]KAI9635669.1 hypothetical protein MKK02DRAFT_44367 [Dioszegia hungarica]